jgi:DNA-binding CsgD family transcriptional regulator
MARLTGALWRVWPTCGAPGDGFPWLERSLAVRDDVPAPAAIELLIGASSFFALQTRDDARTRAIGEELLARAEALNDAYGVYWGCSHLGILAWHAGDAAEAKRRYRAALAAAPGARNPENHIAWARLALARLTLEEGNIDRARDELVQALALHRATGNPFGIATTLVTLAHAALAKGDIAEAVGRLGEALALGRSPNLILLGPVEAAVALMAVAVATGHVVESVRLLGALEAMRASGRLQIAPFFLRVARSAQAEARRRLGAAVFEREHAEGMRLRWDQVLDEARSLANELAGPMPAPAPAADELGGLSPREREVLRELAAGRSNREIADALFVSARTVETHVLHILAKLEVESRTAAAALAIRAGFI